MICPFIVLKQKIKKRKDKRIVRTVFAPNENKRVYLPASATVEASLVIPIYIYAVLAVTYIIQVIGIKTTVSQAAYSSIRQLSRYAYTAELSGDEHNISKSSIKKLITSGMAKKYMLEKLLQGHDVERNIKGGYGGVSVSVVDMYAAENEICMAISYEISNPFDIFGIGNVKISNQYAAAAWIGQEAGKDEIKDGRQDMYVYITAQGTVYHKDRDCTYLNPSVKQIGKEQLESIRNLSGGKYYLCERCAKRKGSEIFITDYGDRYHYDKNCSGLKRSIFSVPISEVQDMRACSKCSK